MVAGTSEDSLKLSNVCCVKRAVSSRGPRASSRLSPRAPASLPNSGRLPERVHARFNCALTIGNITGHSRATISQRTLQAQQHASVTTSALQRDPCFCDVSTVRRGSFALPGGNLDLLSPFAQRLLAVDTESAHRLTGQQPLPVWLRPCSALVICETGLSSLYLSRNTAKLSAPAEHMHRQETTTGLNTLLPLQAPSELIQIRHNLVLCMINVR